MTDNTKPRYAPFAHYTKYACGVCRHRFGAFIARRCQRGTERGGVDCCEPERTRNKRRRGW